MPSSPAHDGSPPEPSAPSPPTQPCPTVEDLLAAEKIVPDQQGHERTPAPQPLVMATSAAQARRLAARKRRKLDALARAPCEQLLENGGETTTAPTATAAVVPPLEDETGGGTAASPREDESRLRDDLDSGGTTVTSLPTKPPPLLDGDQVAAAVTSVTGGESGAPANTPRGALPSKKPCKRQRKTLKFRAALTDEV